MEWCKDQIEKLHRSDQKTMFDFIAQMSAFKAHEKSIFFSIFNVVQWISWNGIVLNASR